MSSRSTAKNLLFCIPLLLSPGLINAGSVVTTAAVVLNSGAISVNAKWGAVMSNTNIPLAQLTLNTAGTTKVLTAGNSAGAKFYGAGILLNSYLEKRVKYQSAGLITDTGGAPVFGALSGSDSFINGVKVTDFFVQVLNGEFGSAWTSATVQLAGNYAWTSSAGEWATTTTGQGILYDASYGHGTGAFVQRDSLVTSAISSLIDDQLSYASWKNYAIANSCYVKPNAAANQFTDSNGNTLYVTPQKTLSTSSSGNTALSSLDQLSRASLIPVDRNTSPLPDEVLFVDTVSGTQNGTKATLGLGSGFFWKGLLYVQNNVSVSGIAAGQSVLMKDPDEYASDPSGSTTGSIKTSCMLDGVFYVAGALQRTGNSSVYGCVIAGTGNSIPDVYFNSRLASDGLAAAPVLLSRLIAE